jgi:hypothetical protein
MPDDGNDDVRNTTKNKTKSVLYRSMICVIDATVIGVMMVKTVIGVMMVKTMSVIQQNMVLCRSMLCVIDATVIDVRCYVKNANAIDAIHY